MCFRIQELQHVFAVRYRLSSYVAFRILTTTFVCCLLSFCVLAQTVPGPKIESPNVAALGKFGEIPIGLFTGTPDISIPIHTLSTGTIKLPVALRYHPGSVRVNQHPGWTGLGWDLQSIGTINRKVNENYDEYCNSFDPGGSIGGRTPYFPYTACTSSFYGPPGSEKVDVSDWNTETRLKSYFTVLPTSGDPAGFSEVGADEFSFSFLGYSGKFYYGGPVKQWQVISDDNIKIELNGFLQPSDVFNAIRQYKQFENVGISEDVLAPRWFKGFTLTVPDGTQFVFGGQDAVEFDSPYGIDGWHFNLNTWLLKKIIDVNGQEVNFEYRRRYPTVSLSFGRENFLQTVFNIQGTFIRDCGFSVSSYGPVDTKIHSGTLFWPMYLNKIVCENETIEFTGSVAICKRYSNIQLERRNEDAPTEEFNVILTLNDNVNNIQWDQLDDIKIKNSNSAIVKQYKFDYTNSTNQRLTLLSLKELDINGGTVRKHEFQYDNIQDLPMYDGNYADHWGFFNNINVNGFKISEIVSQGKRETNPNTVTKGLLTKIIYPTGGYTKLTWQPHDYSKVVSTSRDALSNASGYAGGCRISKVENYLADGVLATEKTYHYKKSYSAGVDLNTLASSGVLNGTPTYVFDLANRPSFDNAGVHNVHFESLNSYSVYSQNGQGSYIGYDEVVEVNKDGSYTKNFFTSYGQDINGVSHFDVTPSTIGWVKGDDPYFIMSSLEKERGKPVGIFDYKSNNVLIKKSITTYRNDQSRFDNYVKIITLTKSWICNTGINSWLALATAHKEFIYSYYPVRTDITNYDQEGNNPLITTTNYSYNNKNQLKETTQANSKSEVIKTVFTYPVDYPTTEPYATMITKNRIAPVIEQSSYKGTTFLQSTKTNYNFWSMQNGWGQPGIIAPYTIEAKTRTNPSEIKVRFHSYDDKGNITAISKENDIHKVYIWGYNKTYPVAEVVGASYSSIMGVLNQAVIQNPSSDQALRDEINKIRTAFPSAMVTSFTYRPLVGLTSQCDVNKKVTYYDYDNFGRLQHIRDQDNFIVKKFCYNYAGQAESCNSVQFGNIAISANYTPNNCPSGQYAYPVLVTVPAGQFMTTGSQENANHHAQVYAQQQANQQAVCFVPVYARIEYEPSWVDEDHASNYDFYDEYVEVWIRFYTDAACTQPYTLTQNLTFTVTSSGMFEDNYETSFFSDGTSVTIQSGTNGKQLEAEYPLWGYYYSYDENHVLTFFERWAGSYTLNLSQIPYVGISPDYNGITLPPWY